jgi:hypothetical protein
MPQRSDNHASDVQRCRSRHAMSSHVTIAFENAKASFMPFVMFMFEANAPTHVRHEQAASDVQRSVATPKRSAMGCWRRHRAPLFTVVRRLPGAQ